MTRIRTEIKSNKGRRTSNQDACIALKLLRNTYLLAIADGMGGVAGGEIASNLVIESIKNYLRLAFKKGINPSQLKGVLKESFMIAQDVLREEIEKDPQLEGFGTTLTVVLIHNQHYVYGNIGDSRIYLYLNGVMEQISEDHSYVQDYLNSNDGKLPNNVLNKYGNYVTRIIDGGQDKPDIFPFEKDFGELHKGDLFLLCSDGLIIDKTHSHADIFTEILTNQRSLKKSANHLVKWAFENGSDDNISVVLGLVKSVSNKKFIIENNSEESEEDFKTSRIDKEELVNKHLEESESQENEIVN